MDGARDVIRCLLESKATQQAGLQASLNGSLNRIAREHLGLVIEETLKFLQTVPAASSSPSSCSELHQASVLEALSQVLLTARPRAGTVVEQESRQLNNVVGGGSSGRTVRTNESALLGGRETSQTWLVSDNRTPFVPPSSLRPELVQQLSQYGVGQLFLLPKTDPRVEPLISVLVELATFQPQQVVALVLEGRDGRGLRGVDQDSVDTSGVVSDKLLELLRKLALAHPAEIPLGDILRRLLPVLRLCGLGKNLLVGGGGVESSSSSAAPRAASEHALKMELCKTLTVLCVASVGGAVLSHCAEQERTRRFDDVEDGML